MADFAAGILDDGKPRCSRGGSDVDGRETAVLVLGSWGSHGRGDWCQCLVPDNPSTSITS
jgi:hypothetical protein